MTLGLGQGEGGDEEHGQEHLSFGALCPKEFQQKRPPHPLGRGGN